MNGTSPNVGPHRENQLAYFGTIVIDSSYRESPVRVALHRQKKSGESRFLIFRTVLVVGALLKTFHTKSPMKMRTALSRTHTLLQSKMAPTDNDSSFIGESNLKCDADRTNGIEAAAE